MTRSASVGSAVFPTRSPMGSPRQSGAEVDAPLHREAVRNRGLEAGRYEMDSTRCLASPLVLVLPVFDDVLEARDPARPR
jgi:hypothetical protein